MNNGPFRLTSVSASSDSDGVDSMVVRALNYPVVPVDGARPRMRRVDLGDLRAALGTGALRFALSLVDGSGRVSGRPIFEHLHWSPGDTLASSVGRAYVVLRPAVDGSLSLDGRVRLGLPPGLLRFCGISPGDQASLIAARDHQMLVVHSMANLAHMARAFHAEQFEQAVHMGMSSLDH